MRFPHDFANSLPVIPVMPKIRPCDAPSGVGRAQPTASTCSNSRFSASEEVATAGSRSSRVSGIGLSAVSGRRIARTPAERARAPKIAKGRAGAWPSCHHRGGALSGEERAPKTAKKGRAVLSSHRVDVGRSLQIFLNSEQWSSQKENGTDEKKSTVPTLPTRFMMRGATTPPKRAAMLQTPTALFLQRE